MRSAKVIGVGMGCAVEDEDVLKTAIGDVHALADAMGLSEDNVRLRKEFLAFGAQDAAVLKGLRDKLKPHEDELIDGFYAHLQAFPETRDLLSSHQHRFAHLKQKQVAYFEQLTGGDYGLEYALSRVQVGMVHQHIGLKPHWHIGAYSQYLNAMLPHVLQHCDNDPEQFLAACVALNKLMLFDLQLSLDAYFHVDHEMLRLFAQVFESNLEAVLIADNIGNILHANKTVTAITGYTPEELIGQSIQSLHSAQSAELCTQIWEVASDGGQWQGEVWQQQKNGDEYPAWMNISPVKDNDGKVTHFITELSNITAFKQTQDALAKRTEELAHSNRELEQFAYVASHDLQEPLRMVASYTQLLARRYKDKLDDDANEFIGYAVDGATRMQALIVDMLALSRIGTHGKPIEPCETTVALDRALANLRLAITESGATITHDVMPHLKADISQLTQLFQNLIGNALKFRGDVAPTVHIGAEQKEGTWHFSVRDNGIGIKPEFFDRIFVIFQRLHGKQEYPGTGIGLSVCKKIVERHGGNIWIESEPDKGTTFHFTLST